MANKNKVKPNLRKGDNIVFVSSYPGHAKKGTKGVLVMPPWKNDGGAWMVRVRASHWRFGKEIFHVFSCFSSRVQLIKRMPQHPLTDIFFEKEKEPSISI